MRQLITALCMAAAASLSLPAYGHDEAELGHHWLTPAYTQELHFQMAIMAILAVIVSSAALIVRFRRRSAE